MQTPPLADKGLLVNPQQNAFEQWLSNQFGPYVQPKDGISWIVSSVEPVTVPTGGAWTNVVSYTVPEGQEGYLKLVGLSVEPVSSSGDIVWKLAKGDSNKAYVPNFGISSKLTVWENTLATPFPFQLTIASKNVITIQASNNGALDLTCVAKMIGFVYPVRRV